jgi:hypothetical protein
LVAPFVCALTLACTSQPLAASTTDASPPDAADAADAADATDGPDAAEMTADAREAAVSSCPSYEIASASITNFDGQGFADGNYFTFDDETGSTTPSPPAATPSALSPPRDGSLTGFHLTGVGHTVFGGGFGVFFVPCADASAFSGLSFWAKGDVSIVVDFDTYETRPVDLGGGCEAVDCAPPGTALQLGTSWQSFTIDFANVTGGTAPLNPASILAISFTVFAPSWDIWVDDLVFY